MSPIQLSQRNYSLFILFTFVLFLSGCGKGDDDNGGSGGSGDGDQNTATAPANVYGQVVLAPGDGLGDFSLVEITLKTGDDEVATTSLDDAGVFEFLDIKGGDYSVEIAYQGGLGGGKKSAYRPYDARFSVDAAGTINLGRLELELGVGTVGGSVSFGGTSGGGEATVSLQGSSGAFQQTTKQGAFAFADVGVGHHVLSVQRDGFTSCEEPVTVSYHGEEVTAGPSLASKAVTLEPSAAGGVSVDGSTWFLKDSSKKQVSIAVNAPFATSSRVWGSDSDPSDYEDFSDEDAIEVSGLAQGRSSYKFQFRSLCGLESEAFELEFVRDSTPPVLDFVTLNSGIPVSQSRTMALAVSARDDISSELEMKIALCDVDGMDVVCSPALEDAPWEPYQFSRSVTFSDTSGNKRIMVQVRDKNGNETPTVQADVVYDPDPPSGISLSVNEILVGESNIVHDNFPLITIGGDGIDEMRVGLEAGLGGVAWRPYQSAFRFEIPGADGPYTLYFQFRDAAGNTTSIIAVPFLMDRTGGVIGNVQLAGQTNHSGAQVALVGTSHIVLTNDDGDFSIEGVAAGRYPLLITKNGFKDHREGVIEIIAADTLDLGSIYMDEFQARVLGNVVLQGFEGKSQHSGVLVRLVEGADPGADPQVLTDAVGNFSLLASPGNYPDGLVFEKVGYETFTRTGDITLLPDGTFNVGEIFLTAVSNVIHGTARRANELNHAGIQVRLLGETGSINEGLELVTTTDATGLYRVEDLPLGPYRLILQDPDSDTRETYERGGIDVVPGPILDMGLVELRNRFLNINGSDALTQTQNVELTLGATDCLQMQVSNLSDFSDATWVDCASPIPWTLTSGQGVKTVYARFLTGADPVNPTEALTDTIVLDSVAGLVSFTHDGGGRTLTEGSVVRFTATGNEPAELVEVSIAGYETGIRLYDNGTNGDATAGDNVYTREFTISRVDDINNAPVTAYFTDSAGNQANMSGPTVTVAIDPLIYAVNVTTSYAGGTATVSFVTDEDTTAIVEWGPVVGETTSWDFTEVIASADTEHSVTFGSGVLIPAETYAVRITATDLAGNSTSTLGKQQFSLLPSVPQKVVAIPGIGRNHLRWEQGSLTSIQGFNIYRSETPGDGTPSKLNDTPYNHEVFLYRDDTVTNGTTYFYTVKSVDLLGNESEVSNESEATPQANSDGPTHVEGVFWDTTVWSEIHSPYVVDSTVSFEKQLSSEAFFIIGPATQVQVAPSEGFLLKGQFAMYGDDSDGLDDAAYYSNDVADTSCPGTYGIHLEFGEDTNEDGVLDPGEVDPTRTYENCGVQYATPYQAPSSECDCGGARCVKWYQYYYTWKTDDSHHIADQCLGSETGYATISANEVYNGAWRDVDISEGPAALYDLRNGEYRLGNVVYKALLANSATGLDSDSPMFVTKSVFRDNSSSVYQYGQSGVGNQSKFPSVVRDSLFEVSTGSGAYQVNLYYSHSFVTNNQFYGGRPLGITNSVYAPVSFRVTHNYFEGDAVSYASYVGGRGVAYDNVFVDSGITSNSDAAGNLLYGRSNFDVDGSNAQRWVHVNNRMHLTEGYRYDTYFGSIYGNVIEHDLSDTTLKYSHNSYYSLLRGNHYYGNFSEDYAVYMPASTVNDILDKNSFMITAANTAGGSGLALWTAAAHTQPNVDAMGNYWGVVTTAEMNAGPNPQDTTAIHDHYDDGDLVRVDYDSWATDSFPLPWVSAPEYFSQYAPGEDVTFGGYGWDVEDAAAASCPAISPSDPALPCPQGGLDNCPAQCFLDSSELRWCATEDDCSGGNQLHLGASFTTQFNAPGIHTVWMRAYDSGGKFVAVPWKIEVLE